MGARKHGVPDLNYVQAMSDAAAIVAQFTCEHGAETLASTFVRLYVNVTSAAHKMWAFAPAHNGRKEAWCSGP